MNASELLLWISVLIVLQLAVGIAMAARRKIPSSRSPPPPVEALPPTGAWSGWRDFLVAERSYEDRANTQCSFCLEPLDRAPLEPFKPGQFLTFSLPASDSIRSSASNGTITRCYSLSDCPGETSYRITVKRISAPAAAPQAPAGVASSYLHDRIQIGDVVKIRAPAGRFYLDTESPLPIVLVAGGIGITPMLSMLLWCANEQPQRSLHLYYGVRNGEDHAFKATLQSAAARFEHFKLCVAYSRPTPSDIPGADFHHAGRVDVNLIRATLPHGRHQFYVCGPRRQAICRLKFSILDDGDRGQC